MAEWVKCWLCEHIDLVWIPSTYVNSRMWQSMAVTLALGSPEAGGSLRHVDEPGQSKQWALCSLRDHISTNKTECD